VLGGVVATARGSNTPALLTAAFFVLSVAALIPARGIRPAAGAAARRGKNP
jgi:hypothetical protein